MEEAHTTACGSWSFGVIPADIGGYPFPTNDRDIRGANPEPYCIQVRAAGSFGDDDMHIYVQDGEQSTCVQIAQSLAQARGRLDRNLSLDQGLDAVLSGQEPGDFRVFQKATMSDWFGILQGQWYSLGAFLGA